MPADPYKYFRPEAKELLEQFSRGVLDLEKGVDDASILQGLFRLAHTLKGAARIVKQSEIASHAHAIEDTLSVLRAAPGKIERPQIDAILDHIDAIGGHLRSLSGPTDAPAQATGKVETEEPSRTIRADIAESDAMLESIAETRAMMKNLRLVVESVGQTGDTANYLVELLGSSFAAERDTRAAAQTPLAIAEELRRKLAAAERALDSGVDRMDRELRQLRETVERLRLVSAKDMFTALERTARDTAHSLSKQVIFKANGDDIRLDVHILETLQRALVQIVRNAVAHGIELPAERTGAGKQAVGNIEITLLRRGRQIVFSCSDDGRGLDLESVRKSAVQRGLLGVEARSLGPDELVRLLLRGGISTSRTVTEEAGRGIGLDVVREAIERLGGEVGCHSEPGHGATFELVIPPSLAAMDVLLVDVEQGHAMAIPLGTVEATSRIGPANISLAGGAASILHNETAIPFVPLSSLLDGRRWTAERHWAVVVVRTADGYAAIGVERLLGTANIITRPLPEYMSGNPIIAATALDADGNPQLVLDAELIIDAARRGAGEMEGQIARLPILIVDDSLTTRMLEQSILESAGYRVETAMSGEEALERVGDKKFALMLVDVEMPGMDGFTFIERVRADPKVRDIPAILVTSLAEPEHRSRGQQVGAQGYIVKSEFNQAELLSMIRSLAA
jgi:two-component system, chemotaxis family, sensor kinase CheA